MRSKAIKLFFFLLLIFAGNFVVFAKGEDGATAAFRNANIAYQKLEYEKSIEIYEQLVKDQFISAEVYYNLGNAYFKAGNFAKAILNYERAKKLTPDDEDIDFNLKIASLKVVDKIEAVPEIFYKRWINNLSVLLPTNPLTILFIISVWLLFISAAFYVTGRTVAMKKMAFVLTIVFLVFSCAGGILAARSHSIAKLDVQAIIMSSSVYVKSSPDEKGNDLFILHEGTKVQIQDVLNDWSKVRIANGSVGWIQTSEMEKI